MEVYGDIELWHFRPKPLVEYFMGDKIVGLRNFKSRRDLLPAAVLFKAIKNKSWQMCQ